MPFWVERGLQIRELSTQPEIRGVCLDRVRLHARCADGSDYVGSARGESLDKRIGEHQAGTYLGYTYHRRPVTLVHAEWFDRITDAVEAERRIKGWSRAKKEALIAQDWDRV